MPRKERVNGVLRESIDEELEHGSNNSAIVRVNDSAIAGYALGLLDRFIAGARVAKRMPGECRKLRNPLESIIFEGVRGRYHPEKKRLKTRSSGF